MLSKSQQDIDTYVEDLKASNIQYTDEELPWFLSVQSFVDSFYQPAEHTIV